MGFIFKAMEKLLRKLILDSFLAQTMPLTRFIVSILLSLSIFINDYAALGIFTAVILLLVCTSVETVRENWIVVAAPVAVGLVMGTWVVLFPGRAANMVVPPLVLVWKFFNLCLAAAVYLILLPQRDLITLVRGLPIPQVWAATIAAFRAVEIGGWAFDTVVKTRRTKRVTLLRGPIAWLDAFITGVCGHFFEFANGFAVSLRTRGVESQHYHPREGLRTFGAVDFLALALFGVGFLGLVRW